MTEPVLQLGVKAILFDEKNHSFLGIRRKPSTEFTLQETYDIPGGRIDANEEPLEGLVREIQEEIGVALKPHSDWKLLTAANIVNTAHRQIVRLTYLVPFDPTQHTITLGNEHTAWQLLPLATSDALHPLLNQAIEEIQRRTDNCTSPLSGTETRFSQSA